MTAVAAPAAPASVDVRRGIRIGLYGGLAAVFVATIGMLETFSTKNVVDPILSLAFALLIGIGLATGFRASPREGDAAHRIVAGALAGLVGGMSIAAFLVFIDAVDVRDVFINISPALIDLMNLQRGLGVGIGLAVGGGLISGGLGAGLGLARPLLRRALIGSAMWVLVVGFLEVILTQIFTELDLGIALAFITIGVGATVLARVLRDRRMMLIGGLVILLAIGVTISQVLSEVSLGLKFIPDFLYASRVGGRALTIPAAAIVFILAMVATLVTESRRSALRQRMLKASDEERQRWLFTFVAVFVGLGVFLPMILGSVVNELLATTGLFLLMGLGLNIVIGYAGLLDLGYVAFFAVGAYTTAILTSTSTTRGWAPGLSFWEALPFVVIAGAVAGVLVGTPVIRMRGDYLAIVTLGFGEIARILFLSEWFTGLTGGAQGVTRIPSIELGFATVKGTNSQAILYMVLIFVSIAAYVSWRLQDSRVGRAWMAMREDEQVAQTMGINIVQSKLLAFVTGAILAAVGGALFAVKFGTIFPASFSIIVSITVLVLIIVGGMGNIPGVAVGALVMIGVLGGRNSPGLLREFSEYKLLIYGAVLLFMMLKRPEGLVPSKRRSRELHQEEALQDAWLRGEIEDHA